MQQSYHCPKCGYLLVFATRFCGNCGEYLNWPAEQADNGHLTHRRKKSGSGLFPFIGLMVGGIVIGVLIAGVIIAHEPSLQAEVSPVISVPQSQTQTQTQTQTLPVPQPLPLAAPVLLSPGLNMDPGQAVDTMTPSFQWNAVSGAEYYALIISKFPYASGNIVCTPPQLSGTTLLIPDGVLEYGQRYRWAIEAHNSTSPSSVSSALYFQTPQPPPSPKSDSTDATSPASRSPSLPSWTPVTLPGWTPI